MGGRRRGGGLMARFLLRRLAGMAGILGAASFLVFSALQLAPGDPASFLLSGRSATPEAIAAIRAQYRLDDPFPVQYLHWIGGVLTGDFGRSVQFRTDVGGLIAARVPITLTLIGMAFVLTIVAGLAFGVWSATRPGAVDKAVLVGSSVAVATPSFVLGFVLIAVFSVNLGWFPSIGAGEGVADRLHHLALPAVALALTFTGVLARVSRTAMIDQLGQEYVTVARGRGVPERTIVRRHVLRGAMTVTLTYGGLLVPGLLISTVLVETAFGVNGLGQLLQYSVTVKDFPVVQALTLLTVAVFVLANIVVDLIAPLADPRVRR
ncbi:ABC transporter permease [Nonomuraea africana]|uniref:Peptide/nickel transport system permease protein n=1 Tax=Nonomuraea africana TaxID=46171 RepID=A0ABR9KB77_9ACTN|nr:ABC transporter permease [Nonomuraea africana]MBE1559266.1 peptide/nickel transport system permease protein [Nonomuraea africana]